MFCAFVENTSKFFGGIHVIIYGRESCNFEMLFSKYFLHGRFGSSTARVPHSLRYLLEGLQRIHIDMKLLMERAINVPLALSFALLTK